MTGTCPLSHMKKETTEQREPSSELEWPSREGVRRSQVVVLVGAGSIGRAIIRRVSAGKHVVLADYSIENAERAAKTLENAGFECSTIRCDLGSKEDILKLVEFATSKGDVTNVVNAAGVSPSQAPVEEILRVDLYGTSVLLEEFGKVIAEGGSGVIISSQSGHRLPACRRSRTRHWPRPL